MDGVLIKISDEYIMSTPVTYTGMPDIDMSDMVPEDLTDFTENSDILPLSEEESSGSGLDPTRIAHAMSNFIKQLEDPLFILGSLDAANNLIAGFQDNLGVPESDRVSIPSDALWVNGEEETQEGEMSDNAYEIDEISINGELDQLDLEEKKNQLPRRHFTQGMVAWFAGLALFPGLTTSDSVNGSNPNIPPNKEVDEEGGHNPDHISKADLFASTLVTTIFTGIVGTPLVHAAIKNKEGVSDSIKQYTDVKLSGKTVVTMFTAWAAKMIILYYDNKTNPDPDEVYASKHAYEHEKEELKNVIVGLLLVLASQATSHINVESGQSSSPEAIQKFKELLIKDGGLDESEVESVVNERTIPGEDALKYAEEIFGDDVVAGSQEHQDFMQEVAGKSAEEELGGIEFVPPDAEGVQKIIDYVDQEFKEKGAANIADLVGVIDTEYIIYWLMDKRFRGEIEEIDSNLEKAFAASVTKKVNQMMTISGILGPLSMTFTSASVANKLIPDIAKELLALKYVRAIRKYDDDAQPPDLYAEFEGVKQNLLNREINGPVGLVNLAVTFAANINGAMLIGDPPNFFYAINHGTAEWLKASAEGFQRALVMNLLIHRAYLGFVVGVPFSQIIDLPGVVGSTKDSIVSIGGSLSRGFTSKVDSFLGVLNKATSEETLGQIFGDSLGSELDIEAQVITEMNKVKEDLEEAKKKSGSNGNLLEITYDWEGLVSDPLKKVSELMILPELLGDIKNSLGGKDGHTDAGVGGSEDEVDGNLVKKTLFGFMRMGRRKNKNGNEEHRQEHGDGHAHAHEDAHHHHHALSHAARDVLFALNTQLWVVGSVQTLVKKFLGLDKPKELDITEVKEQTFMLMTSMMAMGPVADNVAALLFGIGVMGSLSEKYAKQKKKLLNGHRAEVREAVEKASVELQEKIRINALALTVFAGNLSYIGNGANMSIETLLDIVIEFGEDILDPNVDPAKRDEVIKKIIARLEQGGVSGFERGSNDLARSFQNVIAYIVNAMNFGYSLKQEFDAYDKFERDVEISLADHEASSAGHEAPHKDRNRRTFSRRQLFGLFAGGGQA